ncbi:OadG family protein [Arsukibacterium sp.]|uniref:OadG family protein n=1 Tax=Arsukibacterium sp. TaxID=1977258 RepID=UPI002FDA8FDF
MITDLLLESAMLMLLGMGSVFAFLCGLVLLMLLSGKIMQRYFPVKPAEKTAATESSNNAVSPAVVAAISAAVHQYRQTQH